MDGKRERSNIVGPLILIGLGMLFLMQNLGIVDINIWNLIWRFWPVFLIAAGLEMVLGSRSKLGVCYRHCAGCHCTWLWC